jgi:hypothetical protein
MLRIATSLNSKKVHHPMYPLFIDPVFIFGIAVFAVVAFGVYMEGKNSK